MPNDLATAPSMRSLKGIFDIDSLSGLSITIKNFTSAFVLQWVPRQYCRFSENLSIVFEPPTRLFASNQNGGFLREYEITSWQSWVRY